MFNDILPIDIALAINTSCIFSLYRSTSSIISQASSLKTYLKKRKEKFRVLFGSQIPNSASSETSCATGGNGGGLSMSDPGHQLLK